MAARQVLKTKHEDISHSGQAIRAVFSKSCCNLSTVYHAFFKEKGKKRLKKNALSLPPFPDTQVKLFSNLFSSSKRFKGPFIFYEVRGGAGGIF